LGEFFANPSGHPGGRSEHFHVARFFPRLEAGLPDFYLIQYTKTGKNIPKKPQKYHVAIKYTKRQ
jgi:hypothetical protein